MLVVAGHLLLLCAYTFPAEWIPTRLRYWSQAYARILFHQDWRLFAPDPPACACRLEVREDATAHWVPLDELGSNPVWQRMIANACRYTDASRKSATDRIHLPQALSRSLELIAQDVGVEAPAQFRLRRTWTTDPDTSQPPRTETEELRLLIHPR